MSVPPSAADAPLAEPAARGVTRIAPSVVERIAAFTCTQVDGTLTRRATGDTRAPVTRARAEVSGRQAHLSVTVGVRYARSVVTTASAIRQAVTAEVQRMCGLEVVGVDVEALPVNLSRRSRVR